MPTWTGWVIGIAVFACLNLLLGLVANSLGLPTYISYNEPIFVSNRYYDEEINGHQTALGLWTLFISVSAGARAGMAVIEKEWNGGVTAIGNLQLKISFFGVTAYAVIMTSAWEIFGQELMRAPAVISNVLDLAVIGGIGYLSYQHYQNKRTDLQNTREANRVL